MSVSLPSVKLHEIQQVALSLVKTQSVTLHEVMSFWARPIFSSMDIHNFTDCVLSFRVTCWIFFILWLMYFVPFNFHKLCIKFRDCYSCNRVHSPCNFLLLILLLLWMLYQISGPFSFRLVGYLYPLVEHGQILFIRVILPYRNFRWLCYFCVEWPFVYLVRCLPLPYIQIIVLQKLIYVSKVVQYIFYFPD